MRTLIPGLLMAVLAAGGLQAAPSITAGGIVNAASFRPAVLQGAGLARGSLASAFGTGLGPAAGVSATAFPLQTSLAGVSIRMSQGGTAVDAIPVFVQAGQVNFIVASNTPLGQVNVTLTFNGETSAPVTVQVVPVAFGLFTRTGGTGLAIVQNFVSESELPINSPAVSARPRQFLIAYGTGLGAIAGPDNVAPPALDLDVSTEILVGGVAARRVYAGRSPCCAGLDQLVFELADNTPTGCYVPLVVRAGTTYSNAGSVAVSSGGGACSDPVNPFAGAVGSGASRAVGTIALIRSAFSFSFLGQTFDSTLDAGAANFFRVGETFYNPDFAVPALGTCSVYFTRASTDPTELPALPLPAPLDAGTPLRVNGPNGERLMPRDEDGGYSAQLGGGLAIPGAPPPDPLYLAAGRYTITGPGGAQIGAFDDAVLDVGPPLQWTNRDQIAQVRRSNPLTVTWSGGMPGQDLVLITGASTDQTQSVIGVFSCIAPLAPGSFTVPAWVLGSLPDSNSVQGVPVGLLSVGSTTYGNPATFTAPGLDMGFVYYGSTSAKILGYVP